MKENTFCVLLRESTRMGMDGRLGDEVMTNVTVSRRYLKRSRTEKPTFVKV